MLKKQTPEVMGMHQASPDVLVNRLQQKCQGIYTIPGQEFGSGTCAGNDTAPNRTQHGHSKGRRQRHILRLQPGAVGKQGVIRGRVPGITLRTQVVPSTVAQMCRGRCTKPPSRTHPSANHAAASPYSTAPRDTRHSMHQAQSAFSPPFSAGSTLTCPPPPTTP